jgi:hypothetical protein
MTMQQHIEQNMTQIREDARIYAKSYGVSYEKALFDVMGEYQNGYAEAEEQAQYE